jgi:2-amino-4-hydroxy-6-hydroxymethyldihydropteridine diphosphokinase
MTKIYLALGSNLHRHSSLLFAFKSLKKILSNIVSSPVYESVPFHTIGPNFYNVVIAADTDISLQELYEQTKIIEKNIGRDKWVDNEGVEHLLRCLDIDILTYGDLIYSDDKFVLPRQDIFKYEFVAIPLSLLEPSYIPPGSLENVRTIASRMDVNKLKLVKNFSLDL